MNTVEASPEGAAGLRRSEEPIYCYRAGLEGETTNSGLKIVGFSATCRIQDKAKDGHR
jgi:hypothetical protein